LPSNVARHGSAACCFAGEEWINLPLGAGHYSRAALGATRVNPAPNNLESKDVQSSKGEYASIEGLSWGDSFREVPTTIITIRPAANAPRSSALTVEDAFDRLRNCKGCKRSLSAGARPATARRCTNEHSRHDDTWVRGLTINPEKGYNSAMSENRGIAFVAPLLSG
jgi:hypothetical protein